MCRDCVLQEVLFSDEKERTRKDSPYVLQFVVLHCLDHQISFDLAAIAPVIRTAAPNNCNLDLQYLPSFSQSRPPVCCIMASTSNDGPSAIAEPSVSLFAQVLSVDWH